MPALAELYEPIAADLDKVCRIFDDELFSDLPVVNDLCTQVRQYRGKMLRPALLLLSAQACGEVTGEHLTLAAVVELVHVATLVHDDVLDDADLRRRRPTMRRLHGNEGAILLGDYLISHAFHLCSGLNSQYASRTIGATTNTVCEGELLQIHHRGNCDLTMDQYLEIITAKTAVLTATCCRLGARFAGASPGMITLLEDYGLALGIAYQITDDVLDVNGSPEQTGKTLGRDIEKHKLTLPVIHGLAHAAPDVREELLALVQRPRLDRRRVLELLSTTGSIATALGVARRYGQRAISRLDRLPASDARDALAGLARMILDRHE